jgi:hypothetical protein
MSKILVNNVDQQFSLLINKCDICIINKCSDNGVN